MSLIITDEMMTYFKRVKSIPDLQEAEEKLLLNEYLDNNNHKAGEKIISAHLKTALYIALKYKNYTNNMMDLISETNFGLFIALNRFNRELNVRFATYAGYWCKSKIAAYLKCNKVYESHNSSINEKPFEDSDKTIEDIYAVSDADQENKLILLDGKTKLKKYINNFMSLLNDEEKDVFISRWLLDVPLKMEVIGKKHNVSRQRVDQINQQILTRFKKFIMRNDINLKDFYN